MSQDDNMLKSEDIFEVFFLTLLTNPFYNYRHKRLADGLHSLEAS